MIKRKVSKGYRVLRKRKRLLKIKKLEDHAVWRIEVFERAGHCCEKCDSKDRELHPHHFFGKRYKSIATDPDNGVALCVYCHVPYAHGHPAEFEKWMIQKRGQEWYDNLLIKRNRGQGIGQ